MFISLWIYYISLYWSFHDTDFFINLHKFVYISRTKHYAVCQKQRKAR
jgi:hypothetical protein